ncbi:hypothetical protein [Helicobacter cholecystus]|uniref:hypothetical protein n=1 Tax=Helicobacter cholecystus TaxID=45498 RepID=UPI00273928D7|nr:hypothetical protein [Helicobacter cholecystus]
MISSVFSELCEMTCSSPLKETPSESGKYLQFRGEALRGNEETQSYSLFLLFNAIEVESGLKEVDKLKVALLNLPTLENISCPNKVILEEVRGSITGLLQAYEFVIKVRLKGV